MTTQAHLILEDGSAYRGFAFGDTTRAAHGEVVFNTSMTGYQEILTDPSYAGQIVVPTYPIIGNYGVNRHDHESRRIQVSGFVVREHCDAPSHAMSEMTLDEFLKSQGVLGISGVDTRAITRRIRTRGVMMGMIALDESPADALERLASLPDLRRHRLRAPRLHAAAVPVEPVRARRPAPRIPAIPAIR